MERLLIAGKSGIDFRLFVGKCLVCHRVPVSRSRQRPCETDAITELQNKEFIAVNNYLPARSINNWTACLNRSLLDPDCFS